MKRFMGILSVVLILLGLTTPTVVHAEDALSLIMISDQGGIDDKSYNQSAWEGVQAYGQEHGLEKGVGGYNYIHAQQDSEYINSLMQAVNANFDLIVGLGFKLLAPFEEVAAQFPDRHFVIIDEESEMDNIASLNFKDNEAAFLAGVAAASTTKTNKIGFIGGMESFTIDRFRAGFEEGAKAVNPDIEIMVEHVGSFSDPSRAKQQAAVMYSSGVDVIYQAAGNSGNGVFSEAKDIIQNNPEEEIWVIGVDKDQHDEGTIEVNGETRSLTLTSTLKEVGNTLHQFANEVNKEGFTSENRIYGLKEEGVNLTKGQLTKEVEDLVESYRQQIIDSEINVPDTPQR